MAVFDDYIQAAGPRLYALCRKLCGQEWAAQDLYQETWLRAWRARDRYDARQKLDAWLARICVNLYRDGLRRQKILQFLPFATGDAQPNVLDTLAAPPPPEDHSDLHAAVQALPEPQRLVITLYYFCDKNVEETAQALNIPTGTVKSRLAKARETLKRRLEHEET